MFNKMESVQKDLSWQHNQFLWRYELLLQSAPLCRMLLQQAVPCGVRPDYPLLIKQCNKQTRLTFNRQEHSPS